MSRKNKRAASGNTSTSSEVIHMLQDFCVVFVWVCFMILRIKPRALSVLSTDSTTKLYSQSHTSRFLKLVSLKQMPATFNPRTQVGLGIHSQTWQGKKVSSTPLTGDFHYHLSTRFTLGPSLPTTWFEDTWAFVGVFLQP